jgi:hypothetical protein
MPADAFRRKPIFREGDLVEVINGSGLIGYVTKIIIQKGNYKDLIEVQFLKSQHIFTYTEDNLKHVY